MDPKMERTRRGMKRKRGGELIPNREKLSPVERRILEEKRSKKLNLGPLHTVYIFPLSFLKPIKSDFDKIRGRLADLTVSFLLC